MIVYKYLHPDRMDVLQNAAIRFTQPTEFNDPFESLPCFSAYRERIKEDLLAKRVKQFGPESASIGLDLLEVMIDACLHNIPERLSQHFVILSLSRTPTNLLMWAHYADCHRGFVIGFDSSSRFFEPGNGKALDGLRAVIYSSTRAVVPSIGLQFSHPTEMNAFNEAWFFTKCSDWAYEEEMRILASPQAADTITLGKNGCSICLFKFPVNAVKEVILGTHMPSNTLAEFIELSRRKYADAKLFIASLNPQHFSVDVKPIQSSQIEIFRSINAT
jgi:hypothetical protein